MTIWGVPADQSSGEEKSAGCAGASQKLTAVALQPSSEVALIVVMGNTPRGQTLAIAVDCPFCVRETAQDSDIYRLMDSSKWLGCLVKGLEGKRLECQGRRCLR